MKRIVIALAVVGVLGLGAILWSNNSCNASDGKCQAHQNTSRTESRASSILAEVAAGEARLIDVREKVEFESGHAPTAELVPVGDIMDGKLDESNKNRKIYLYCRSGNRAGQALSALEKQGYTNVTNLGGLSDWSSAGGELVK